MSSLHNVLIDFKKSNILHSLYLLQLLTSLFTTCTGHGMICCQSKTLTPTLLLQFTVVQVNQAGTLKPDQAE